MIHNYRRPHHLQGRLFLSAIASLLSACGGGGGSATELSAVDINGFSSSCIQASQTYVRELQFVDFYIDRKVFKITNTCSDTASALKIWVCLYNPEIAPVGTSNCTTQVFTRSNFSVFVEPRNSQDVTLFTVPANQAVWTDTDRWNMGSSIIIRSWLLNYDCNGQFDSITRSINFTSCFPA